MMKSVQYTCKYCGATRFAHYDPACPALDLEKFKKILCCDRCFDYETGMIRLRESLSRVCVALELARIRSAPNLNQTEETASKIVTHLTKKIATRICRRFGVADAWEPSFPEMILDNPGKWSVAVDVFTRMIRKQIA